jgi:4'-phosphopantetheinyl transferase
LSERHPLRGGTLPLRSGELHVWAGTLELPAGAVERLHGLLSPDERERAARFRFDRDRNRYIAGRGQLRLLLSRYTGTPPAELAFRYGAFDKPELTGGGPHFNVSHSGAVLLIGVTPDHEVGVDVELDSTDLARERIPERFFSPEEVRTLRSLPEALQARAFLACWTRKEAFIKARGDGLSLALDSFDVTLAPGQPVAVRRTAWSQNEPKEWCVIDLSDVNAGYVAAVAVRSTDPLGIRRFDLPSIGMTLSEQETR